MTVEQQPSCAETALKQPDQLPDPRKPRTGLKAAPDDGCVIAGLKENEMEREFEIAGRQTLVAKTSRQPYGHKQSGIDELLPWKFLSQGR